MKSTMTRLMLVLTFGWVMFSSALAGDLEPPGPPAPTMVTLQEIYDVIQGQTGTGFPVAKTGQAVCWDASGNGILCAGTGQDGEYQAGVSVSPRFTDNGDGTVKDNLTSLIWLENADCFGTRNWTNALTDANTLSDGSCGLTDGSVAGDWRLPNLRELQSLISYQSVAPALPGLHPFSGVQGSFYWCSTSHRNLPSSAWYVELNHGFVSWLDKGNVSHVWPVRGGQ